MDHLKEEYCIPILLIIYLLKYMHYFLYIGKLQHNSLKKLRWNSFPSYDPSNSSDYSKCAKKLDINHTVNLDYRVQVDWECTQVQQIFQEANIDRIFDIIILKCSDMNMDMLPCYMRRIIISKIVIIWQLYNVKKYKTC